MRTGILTISFVCCALLTLGAQSPAPAGQAPDPRKSASDHDAHPAPRPPFKWWTSDSYKQELKLTNEQSAEIEKIFQASMDRLRVDKDDFDRAQANFSQLMDRTGVDDREFQRIPGESRR